MYTLCTLSKIFKDDQSSYVDQDPHFEMELDIGEIGTSIFIHTLTKLCYN